MEESKRGATVPTRVSKELRRELKKAANQIFQKTLAEVTLWEILEAAVDAYKESALEDFKGKPPAPPLQGSEATNVRMNADFVTQVRLLSGKIENKIGNPVSSREIMERAWHTCRRDALDKIIAGIKEQNALKDTNAAEASQKKSKTNQSDIDLLLTKVLHSLLDTPLAEIRRSLDDIRHKVSSIQTDVGALVGSDQSDSTEPRETIDARERIRRTGHAIEGVRRSIKDVSSALGRDTGEPTGNSSQTTETGQVRHEKHFDLPAGRITIPKSFARL